MTVNLLTEDLDETTIPEKFKDPETGDVKVQSMINSYRELEKQFSQRPSAPKKPEDYCIDCSHGMFESDAEVNRRLHEKGFTEDQAQEVYNLAAEKMVPMVKEVVNELHADREVEKLVEHFGGAEKWEEVARQLLAFGQKSLPEDVLNNLTSSYEGVLALHRMMKSGEPSLKKTDGVAQGLTEDDLNSMMNDPKYWRDRDAGHVNKVTEGFKKIYGGK